jgi:hypothetical protein
VWYDPAGKILHILLRCNTNGGGYGSILRALEDGSGLITLDFERAPSGQRYLFLPLPGGHLKFFVSYDDVSRSYWLASSLVTDSMLSLECIPEGRYNLPSNQRNAIALHFSRNCVDWCFAGIISRGESERHARNYPAFAFDRRDLLVVARSGDDDAVDCQYTNLITFHRVKNFRDLLY